MSKKDNLSLGRMLVEQGVITDGQLAASLEACEERGISIATAVLTLGLASEARLFSALSERLGIPYVEVRSRTIDESVIRRIPPRLASHYQVIPLESSSAGLTVAVADPLDVQVLDELRLLLGVEVRAVLAAEAQIREAIRTYYGVGADTLEQIIADQDRKADAQADRRQAQGEVAVVSGEVQNLEALAQDASIITFVNQILGEAIRDRATDIHLEPFQEELRTRFRIDGLLYPVNIPQSTRHFHPAIVSRIKIMAALDIAEHRLPQDGRIKIRLGGEELDLRVSILPSVFGEAVHIRLLNPRSFLELERLGMLEEDQRIIETVIRKPHGVIFVTGPTGSGKTTTLYAALQRISSASVKIITIEDPVEYQLPGITQQQVAPKIGFDFAAGLRHTLRHDPDIMMVGEVRDYETAEIATRAALTGHLVFSTLHTNDAAGAVTRLLDMGIEPFLVSSSLECLIAQRLVRVICNACKAPAEVPREIRAQMEGVSLPQPPQAWEGKGCEACRFTGFYGRTGIYEILTVSAAIRDLILERASSQQIKQKAIQQGMRTLRQDGLRKASLGLTTFAEVMRVTQQEEIPED